MQCVHDAFAAFELCSCMCDYMLGRYSCVLWVSGCRLQEHSWSFYLTGKILYVCYCEAVAGTKLYSQGSR